MEGAGCVWRGGGHCDIYICRVPSLPINPNHPPPHAGSPRPSRSTATRRRARGARATTSPRSRAARARRRRACSRRWGEASTVQYVCCTSLVLYSTARPPHLSHACPCAPPTHPPCHTHTHPSIHHNVTQALTHAPALPVLLHPWQMFHTHTHTRTHTHTCARSSPSSALRPPPPSSPRRTPASRALCRGWWRTTRRQVGGHTSIEMLHPSKRYTREHMHRDCLYYCVIHPGRNTHTHTPSGHLLVTF
jgi:hypothetical protein